MSDKPTLFSLTDEMQGLMAALEATEVDENGEIQPGSELLARLENTELQFNRKLEQCAFVTTQLDSEAKTLKDWAARFRDAAEAKEPRVQWMKEYVKACMGEVGMVKAQAGPYQFRVQRNPAGVEITDPKAVPAAFMVVPEPYPDKAKIKQALKDGEAVAGAKLITDRTHLRIGPLGRGERDDG